jgi:hypothetical protein
MVTRLIVVFGVLFVGACDSAPTVPSPRLTLPPWPAPPPRIVRVAGRVTDERAIPIAGASISVFQEPKAVSSADGFYELSGAFGSPYGTGLFATREGYERNYQWVPAATEAVRNFRLRGVVRITAGEDLRVALDSDDTLYGSSEQYRARRVRVVAPRKGTLVIEGSSPTGHPVRLSDQEFEYFPCCPARLGVAVRTGQEVAVHVLTYLIDVPAEFSITTRLEFTGAK